MTNITWSSCSFLNDDTDVASVLISRECTCKTETNILFWGTENHSKVQARKLKKKDFHTVHFTTIQRGILCREDNQLPYHISDIFKKQIHSEQVLQMEHVLLYTIQANILYVVF